MKYKNKETKLIDTENKLVVARDRKGVRAEMSKDVKRYKFLVIKKISHGDGHHIDCG